MADTRYHILDAAHRVVRQRGLAGATTKEIAREAGCSEGTLYNHFQDKQDLVMCLMRERMPYLAAMLALPDKAGKGTVRGNLEEIAELAVDFFREVIPMTASVFSEPDLLERQREFFRPADPSSPPPPGPHRAYHTIAEYIRAEQRLGRVRDRVGPTGIGAALIGACFHYAFLTHLVDPDLLPIPRERFAKDIVKTLMDALTPNGAKRPKE